MGPAAPVAASAPLSLLASLLGGPPGLALYWAVLARVGGVFAVAPVLSSASAPAQVRAALSVLVALAVLPAARVRAPALPHALLPYYALLAHEAAVGLVIGFVARVVFSAAETAGGLIDLQMGFSVGSLIDPVYGEPATILGTFLNALGMLLFLLGGGLELLVLATAGSYAHIPVGAPALFAPGASAAVSALAWATTTALEVAAPALALAVVLNLVLGLVGRAVPQLNVLSSAMPLQVLAGLLALLLAVPVITAVLGGLSAETAARIGGLMP